MLMAWRTSASRILDRLRHWLNFSTCDRCLTLGMPDAMTPGFDNHKHQFLQTPVHAARVVAMIHDTRMISVDGRSHVPATIGQWMGHGGGHWEADTLVIKTVNLAESDRVGRSDLPVSTPTPSITGPR